MTHSVQEPRGAAGPKAGSFLEIATRTSVVRRAARIALVVGCALAIINHGCLTSAPTGQI